MGKTHYARLDQLRNSKRAHRRPIGHSEVMRIRVNRLGAVWQTIKGASLNPHMITMAPGKADSLGPLLGLWEDAYRGLSSAADLSIVGYSMPRDDIEIRTLLRAGVLRGPSDPTVRIWNPAPDVHIRIKEYIFGRALSDFTSVPPVA